MEAKFAKSKISGIEEELEVLKAQLTAAKKKTSGSFSSLEGLWKGKADFTIGEIKAVELKLEGK